MKKIITKESIKEFCQRWENCDLCPLLKMCDDTNGDVVNRDYNIIVEFEEREAV